MTITESLVFHIFAEKGQINFKEIPYVTFLHLTEHDPSPTVDVRIAVHIATCNFGSKGALASSVGNIGCPLLDILNKMLHTVQLYLQLAEQVLRLYI